ncbi:MAG TPA: hypothetical protein VJL32_00455 [Candidatus Paceibacterota bacterium]
MKYRVAVVCLLVAFLTSWLGSAYPEARERAWWIMLAACAIFLALVAWGMMSLGRHYRKGNQ